MQAFLLRDTGALEPDLIVRTAVLNAEPPCLTGTCSLVSYRYIKTLSSPPLFVGLDQFLTRNRRIKGL